MIIRKEIGFRDREYSYQYLKTYQAKYPSLPTYKILEIIFEEHAKMKKDLAERDDLSKKISQQVIGELKKPLDITRVRTGYIDKNVRALLLILNSFILARGLDDKLPVKNIDFMAQPIQDALDKITAEIQNYRTTKKNDRESDQS